MSFKEATSIKPPAEFGHRLKKSVSPRRINKPGLHIPERKEDQAIAAAQGAKGKVLVLPRRPVWEKLSTSPDPEEEAPEPRLFWASILGFDLGIASLILLVALFFNPNPLLAWFFLLAAVLGIVFSIIGIIGSVRDARGEHKYKGIGYAIAGLIASSILFVLIALQAIADAP